MSFIRPLDVFKLMLGLSAVVLFFVGMKTEVEAYRWAAIVCLALAVALRWVKPRSKQ